MPGCLSSANVLCTTVIPTSPATQGTGKAQKAPARRRDTADELGTIREV